MMNFLLCGFMGCGKTTVGRRLSHLMGWEYIDLDLQIEQENGMSIPQIFAQHGESYFRDLEHEAILGLSKRIRCIVSTGGGALTFERNLSVISPKDHVIFLDAPFALCYSRIQKSDRPIVQQNSKEQLEALFNRRHPLYQKAAQKGWVVDARLPLDEICEQIMLVAGTK